MNELVKLIAKGKRNGWFHLLFMLLTSSTWTFVPKYLCIVLNSKDGLADTVYNLLLYERTKISRPCAKTERSFQTFAKGRLVLLEVYDLRERFTQLADHIDIYIFLHNRFPWSGLQILLFHVYMSNFFFFLVQSSSKYCFTFNYSAHIWLCLIHFSLN